MKRGPAALLAAMVLSLLVWAPVSAAPDPPAAPPLLLKMVQAINPVTINEPFKVVVRPSSAITDAAQVTVSVYAALQQRSDVGKSDLTKGEARQSSRRSQRLAKMGRTADGDFIVEFPIGTNEAKVDRVNGLLVRGPGVYPVLVDLSDGKSPHQQLASYLTVLPDPAERTPLDVSVAVPLDAPLSLQPDGSRHFEPADLNRLDKLAGVLAAWAKVPISVVPTPETMVGLKRNPETRPVWSHIESAIGERSVVAPPYVPIDSTAFFASAPADELTRQLTAGNEALAAILPGRVDAQTYIADGLIDSRTAESLQSDRVNHVVLDPANLEEGVPANSTVVELNGLRGPSPRIIAASTSTMQRFMLTPDSAQAQTELWADLALAWIKGTVGVVLVTRDLPALVPAKVDELLAALSGASRFTQVVALDSIYTDVATAESRSKPLTATLKEPPGEQLGQYSGRISEARFRQSAITAMLPAGDPRHADLGERLLVASHRGLPEDRRNQYLSAVQQRLDEVVACITPPRDDRLSVFSESSVLPVVIINRCDTALSITLRLSSDRLDFPKGSSQTVTLRPNETLRALFDMRVRTAGPIPVNVELLTPTPLPVRLGLPSRMTVSSGAVSGIGILLSVAAGALLSLWWIVHLRAKRRDRRSTASGVSAAPEGA
ncbi:MAG: hypothetical protein JWL70_2422 [Acidimicrobiia bacterium]|nr:hypothetical protein [Acidimicrobiia bacterium]